MFQRIHRLIALEARFLPSPEEGCLHRSDPPLEEGPRASQRPEGSLQGEDMRAV